MKVEIRSDHVVLEGYVNVTNRDSREFMHNGKKTVERIMPGVFENALSEAKNVDLMLNHDRVIGSTNDNNLELYEDNVGLKAICTVFDEVVINKAKEDKLNGWSFGFIDSEDDFEIIDSDSQRRFVTKLTLQEVSIIDDTKVPVYIATSIEQRSDGTKTVERRAELSAPKATIKHDYSRFETVIDKLQTTKN